MHKVIRHVLRRWRMKNSITVSKLAKQTRNEIWVRTCVSVLCHPSYIRLDHVCCMLLYTLSIKVVTNSNECYLWILSLVPPTKIKYKSWTNTEHTYDMRYVLIYNLKTQQWNNEAYVLMKHSMTHALIYSAHLFPIQISKCSNDYFILQSHNNIIIVYFCMSLNAMS